MRTLNQNNYYQSLIVPKVTAHFNATKKKWYMIPIWTRETTHNWFKHYYFDGSTKEIEYENWEEIMTKIRVNFSKEWLWIPKPWEDNEAPIQ